MFVILVFKENLKTWTFSALLGVTLMIWGAFWDTLGSPIPPGAHFGHPGALFGRPWVPRDEIEAKTTIRCPRSWVPEPRNQWFGLSQTHDRTFTTKKAKS